MERMVVLVTSLLLVLAATAAGIGCVDSSQEDEVCALSNWDFTWQRLIDELMNCNGEVNDTLNNVVDKISNFFSREASNINKTINAFIQLEMNNTNYSSVIRLVEQLQKRQISIKNNGERSMYPAKSCREIAKMDEASRESGLYWVQTCQLDSFRVYCDLEKVLDGTKGWMRIAFLNMTDVQQQCPPGFDIISTTGKKRLCGRTTYGPGCNSVTFKTPGVQYQKVCGRVIAYQYNSPDAFKRVNCPSPCTIDNHYVDGIYRWLREINTEKWEVGVKTTPIFTPLDIAPHPTEHHQPSVLLHEPTIDDLELRLCLDEDQGNEDVPIELVELYVQ